MSKKTDKNSPNTKPHIEYLGWWGSLLMVAKVAALTAAIVSILKYVFGLPLF